MTTTINARVYKRPPETRHDPELPWSAYAVAIDYEHPNPVETIRITRTEYAHSFPEALQLAQVHRKHLHDVLMDEVHASPAAPARRRTNE